MEFKKFVKLDNYLRIYSNGHIDERYYFLRNATEEQQKDLLAFIIYCRANLINKLRITETILHDMFNINKNEPNFLPRSHGYAKKITLTKLLDYENNKTHSKTS